MNPEPMILQVQWFILILKKKSITFDKIRTFSFTVSFFMLARVQNLFLDNTFFGCFQKGQSNSCTDYFWEIILFFPKKKSYENDKIKYYFIKIKWIKHIWMK